MIQNEVAILKKVKHPNIIELKEEFNSHLELYLVMELVKVSQKQRQASLFQSVWFHHHVMLMCCMLLRFND